MDPKTPIPAFSEVKAWIEANNNKKKATTRLGLPIPPRPSIRKRPAKKKAPPRAPRAPTTPDGVRLLLAKMDTDEAKGVRENTPLHDACRTGDLEAARRLLSSGTSVNVRDKNKDTPLHLASRNGHYDVVNLLVDKNANVSAKNKDGRLPIHEACHEKHEYIVKVLGDYGNLYVKDLRGVTPMSYLTRKGYDCLGDALVNAECEYNAFRH